MEPKLPLPTDSLYKFCALFGLALMIAGMALFVINLNTSNARITLNAEAYYSVSDDDPYKGERQKMYQNRIDVTRKDQEFYKPAIGAIIGAGLAISMFGFTVWGLRVQPIQLKMLELEKEKLELEVAILRKEVGTNVQPNAEPGSAETDEPDPEDGPGTDGHTA